MIENTAILELYNKQVIKNEIAVSEILALRESDLIDRDTLEERLRTGFLTALNSLKQSTVEECNSKDIVWSDEEWDKISAEMQNQFRLEKIKGKYTKQYILVFTEKEMKPSVTKMKASTTAQKMLEQELCITKYLSSLENYRLPDSSISILKGYFRYLMQKRIRNIQYNFIIQTDDDETAKKFVQELYDIVGKITAAKKRIHYMTEKNIVTCNNVGLETNDVFLVSNLLENKDYYSNDYEDSSLKTQKNKYDDQWTACMDCFEKYYQKSIILCGPKKIIKTRIKNNTRMNRFFRNFLILENMGTDEIYQSIMEKLNTYTKHKKEFEHELKMYVDTVYPKAPLKNEDFVDDLYAKLLTLAFENNEGRCLTEKSIPYYERKCTFDSIDVELRNLVGLTEVKEKFKEIGILCKNINSNAKMPNFHMIFRGNPGTGKTTVAQYVAKLLNSMGVIKNDKIVQVMASDLIAVYLGQTGTKTRNVIERASGGVLFVDEAYLLNPSRNGNVDTYREECLGELIKAMERGSDPVIIFAGYPKEMDDFTKANPGFRSRIGFTMEFEDYDSTQLLEIFKNICDKNGYSFDEGTIQAANKKITAVRYDDNFGNARTVENIFNQAVIESLKNGRTDKFIGEEDIVVDKKLKNYEELMEELNEKVGLENAKKVIRGQAESNKFCREMGIAQPSSNNMLFIGNSGTGKTTTAKLFSEMLFTIGVAKSPRMKAITARDLFVQNVAEKLGGYFREAMGGVLFIDELYLLQSAPYHCAEVVSVLLEKLEENREDITVILAGYEQQMGEFLAENQGLASRFPIIVKFDDFTEDELVSIFVRNCTENGMTVSEDGVEKFRQVIKREIAKDNFGNGRSVRNIFEQAFRNHAVNFYSNQYEGTETCVISADDIEELSSANESKTKFGFRAG